MNNAGNRLGHAGFCNWLQVLAIGIAMTACATDPSDNGIEDFNDTAEGKADETLNPDSQLAKCIVEFANVATEDELISTIRLSRPVASNVVVARSTDGNQFSSLEELDAVPGVGANVLSAMGVHVSSTCTVPAMVDLGPAFIAVGYRLREDEVTYDPNVLRFLPGAAGHGTYIIAYMADEVEGRSPNGNRLSRFDFQSYWGTTLGTTPLIPAFSTGTGVSNEDLIIGRFDLTMSYWSVIDFADIPRGLDNACVTRSGPTAPFVLKQLATATPGAGISGGGLPSVTASLGQPFVSEICRVTTSGGHALPQSYIEIYVP